MNEPTTLGPYLRHERERRGLTLRTISESTKVSVALLDGLEGDDISRWPGGIFQRAFVRSYAQCVGLDADDVVRRFERQYHPSDGEEMPLEPVVSARVHVPITRPKRPASLLAWNAAAASERRARLLGTAADLTVAVILALGSAAAGSRLLWPVLLIAGYYAIGILLTGTSPMVALLSEQTAPQSATPAPVELPAVAQAPARGSADRRHQPRRTHERPRPRRGIHAHSS